MQYIVAEIQVAVSGPLWLESTLKFIRFFAWGWCIITRFYENRLKTYGAISVRNKRTDSDENITSLSEVKKETPTVTMDRSWFLTTPGRTSKYTTTTATVVSHNLTLFRHHQLAIFSITTWFINARRGWSRTNPSRTLTQLRITYVCLSVGGWTRWSAVLSHVQNTQQ